MPSSRPSSLPAVTRRVLTCGGGAYERTPDGRWRYHWQAPVPGARDLTVAEVEHVGGDPVAVAELFRRVLLDGERELLARPRPTVGATGGAGAEAAWRARGKLVLGLQAPELHVSTMLDTGQIAGMLEVTRDTVDSYRSRGAMVAPQLYRSRTPLWAAPVVRHWIAGRPSTSARRRAR